MDFFIYRCSVYCSSFFFTGVIGISSRWHNHDDAVNLEEGRAGKLLAVGEVGKKDRGTWNHRTHCHRHRYDRSSCFN